MYKHVLKQFVNVDVCRCLISDIPESKDNLMRVVYSIWRILLGGVKATKTSNSFMTQCRCRELLVFTSGLTIWSSRSKHC